MDRKEFRVLIEHCFLMGKNTVEAKQGLYKRHGDSPPGKSTIIDWYSEFKRGRTNTDDTERTAPPKSAVVPENMTKIHKIVLGDRKLKLREFLRMRKLFSKWVLRFCSHPTINNNTTRIQSAVWSCSSEVKKIFYVGMWQWMNPGLVTIHLKQKDSQLNGE